RGARHLGAAPPERPGRDTLLSQTLEGTAHGAACPGDRSTGELRGGQSRYHADRFPPAQLAREQPSRELAPTRPPTRTNAPAVQEPAARGALLFGLQYDLQPVSAGPPCVLGFELSHGDASALAGMGHRLGNDRVRCGGVRSCSKRPYSPRAS